MGPGGHKQINDCDLRRAQGLRNTINVVRHGTKDSLPRDNGLFALATGKPAPEATDCPPCANGPFAPSQWIVHQKGSSECIYSVRTPLRIP